MPSSSADELLDGLANRFARNVCRQVNAAIISASSRLTGLNGETNSLKRKKSSATIVADVT